MNCRRNKNARTTGHFFESWNGKRNLVRFDHSNEKLLIHSDVSPSSRCYWRMLILDDLDVCSYSTVRQRLFNHPRRLPALYLFFSLESRSFVLGVTCLCGALSFPSFINHRKKKISVSSRDKRGSDQMERFLGNEVSKRHLLRPGFFYDTLNISSCS